MNIIDLLFMLQAAAQPITEIFFLSFEFKISIYFVWKLFTMGTISIYFFKVVYTILQFVVNHFKEKKKSFKT